VRAPERRRALRSAAQEKRAALRDVRARITRARATRAQRRKARLARCRDRRAALKQRARDARSQLAEKLRQRRDLLKEACSRSSISEALAADDQVERLIAQAKALRAEIDDLVGEARRTRSDTGRAGGRRLAELRSESDQAVEENVVQGDPVLAAVWRRERKNFPMRGSQYASRSELFSDWLAANRWAITEETARQEADQDRQIKAWEARMMQVPETDFADWIEENPPPLGSASDAPF